MNPASASGRDGRRHPDQRCGRHGRGGVQAGCARRPPGGRARLAAPPATGHHTARPARTHGVDHERPLVVGSDPVRHGLHMCAIDDGSDAGVVTARDHALASRHELRERRLDLVAPAGVEVDVIDVHVRHDADPMRRQQERTVALVRLEDEQVAIARRARRSRSRSGRRRPGSSDRDRRPRAPPPPSRSSWSCRACPPPRSSAYPPSMRRALGRAPIRGCHDGAPRPAPRSARRSRWRRPRHRGRVRARAQDRCPTSTSAPRPRSSASPFESLRSDPLTAMPRARSSFARFRMPAPPMPIRWRRDTPSSDGHVQRRDASRRRRVPPRLLALGHVRTASTTRDANRAAASGFAHSLARAPMDASLSGIVHERQHRRREDVRRAARRRAPTPRHRRAPARARSRLDGPRWRADTAPGSTAARTPPAPRWSSRPTVPRPDRRRRIRAPSDPGTARTTTRATPRALSRARELGLASRTRDDQQLEVASFGEERHGRGHDLIQVQRALAPAGHHDRTALGLEAQQRPSLLGESGAMRGNVQDRRPHRVADHLDPRAAGDPAPSIVERDRDGGRRSSEQSVRQAGDRVRLVEHDRDMRPPRREHRRHAHVPAHAHGDVGAAHERGTREHGANGDHRRLRGAHRHLAHERRGLHRVEAVPGGRDARGFLSIGGSDEPNVCSVVAHQDVRQRQRGEDVSARPARRDHHVHAAARRAGSSGCVRWTPARRRRRA